METVADRAITSRKTLQRIEQGDHGVSVGIYASVLNALGPLDGLTAPGSSLVGARPIASVMDSQGELDIDNFVLVF